MRSHSVLVRRVCLSLLVLLFATSCSTVPITGRKSFNLIPDDQAMALGEQSYQQVLSTAKLIKSGRDYDMVVRVGRRIAAISDQPDLPWEFALIDDPKTVNAWCLPGGKVAVYSGLMPVAQTEGGLATVMAHEIAHAIAKHGSERMTDELALQVGQAGLAQLLQEKSAATQTVVMAAYGAGTTVGVMLPFSRSQESEADHIGLVYMARAGYDPHEALTFWQRMLDASNGGAPPAFLSDHPANETRIKQIEKWMPQAMKEYRPR
jgi:predicted Zn-dependent protease